MESFAAAHYPSSRSIRVPDSCTFSALPDFPVLLNAVIALPFDRNDLYGTRNCSDAFARLTGFRPGSTAILRPISRWISQNKGGHMKGRVLLMVALAFAATGCATSKLNYNPPPIGTVDNQVTINGSFDSVWDRLVKNLASDFFVINNIEKTSRIINVSFLSNTPPEFVSCGISFREFSNARGTQKYEYDPASSTQYTFTDEGGLVFNAVRTARLNGRANVYVAPSDDGNTLVSVNTKYVVDVTQSFTNVYGQPVGTQNFTFDFSTKQPQVTPDGVTCVAKGNLERKILDYAK